MKNIISIGMSKEAALYFDRVFPDDFLTSTLAKIRNIPLALDASVPLDDFSHSSSIIGSLLPDIEDPSRLLNLYTKLSIVEILIQMCRMEFIRDAVSLSDMKRLVSAVNSEANINLRYPTSQSEDEAFLEKVRKEKSRIIKSLGFESAPSWVNDSVFDASERSNDQSAEDHFVLSIRGMKLVDPSKLKWDAVIELRNDVQSMKDLRNLRLFLQENYAGKDPSYVSDKLASLEDNYTRTTKLWGLETAHRTLSVAFTQQSAMMTAAGGISTALAGAPVGVVAAAATVVPLGGIALEFSKALLDSFKSKQENPLKYLTHLRNLSNDRPGSSAI